MAVVERTGYRPNLIALGHRRIAHVAGVKRALSASHRINGYQDALREAGIPIVDELIQAGDFSMESGAAAMERLLDLAQPPTAVFAGNDEMAFGAMSVARVRGGGN